MAQTETELTKELKASIWEETTRQGVFGCFEVTIGWFGKERVDYITYDTKGVWRCFEIKITKQDFRSKAHNTFIGNFNYYVMPHELYKQLKEEIPSGIGVYTFYSDKSIGVAKKAKKQVLKIDEQVLKNSMIRSLYREVDKSINSESLRHQQDLMQRLQKAEKKATDNDRAYTKLSREYFNVKHNLRRKYQLDIEELIKIDPFIIKE